MRASEVRQCDTLGKGFCSMDDAGDLVYALGPR